MVKTGGTQVPTPKSNKLRVNPGDKVKCIKSQSNAYTEGRTYEVYLNGQGHKCLMGDDGLEDLWSMLVSSFKKI